MGFLFFPQAAGETNASFNPFLVEDTTPSLLDMSSPTKSDTPILKVLDFFQRHNISDIHSSDAVVKDKTEVSKTVWFLFFTSALLEPKLLPTYYFDNNFLCRDFVDSYDTMTMCKCVFPGGLCVVSSVLEQLSGEFQCSLLWHSRLLCFVIVFSQILYLVHVQCIYNFVKGVNGKFW